jgi:hypothetical protein
MRGKLLKLAEGSLKVTASASGPSALHAQRHNPSNPVTHLQFGKPKILTPFMVDFGYFEMMPSL